jgi:hypothetical protein
MVVLVIIAAMMTVVIPYATRSNEALKTAHECLSLADTIRYIADLAADTKRPTRILIDSRGNRYVLEMANSRNNRDYEPIEALGDAVRYFGQDIRIIETTGFSMEGNDRSLVFDPARPWPSASISLSSVDGITTITIRGGRVEIEDQTD